MTREGRRWRTVALLALGIALGIALTASPAGSHVAGWTHNWKKHIRPRADARYLPGANLPRGKTIRGTYAVRDVASSSSVFETSISFGHALRAAPTPHLLIDGQAPTAACPGSAANPTAAIGHLCVYESSRNNVIGYSFDNPTGQPGSASRWGTTLGVQSSTGAVWSSGTWAVRAP